VDGRVLAGGGEPRDSAVTALVKWIPIEVIAFYEGITTPFGNDIGPFLIYAIVVGMVATLLWTAFATGDKEANSAIAWRQVVLATLAFAFWVVGTTSPELWKGLLGIWHPALNPMLLTLGAFALPIVDGALRKFGVLQD
jgi:ABC-type Na+ efflux pump permease subunit